MPGSITTAPSPLLAISARERSTRRARSSAEIGTMPSRIGVSAWICGGRLHGSGGAAGSLASARPPGRREEPARSPARSPVNWRRSKVMKGGR